MVKAQAEQIAKERECNANGSVEAVYAGAALAPRPLNICLVIAGLGAGGAERVLSWLARNYGSSGAKVTILSFDGGETEVYHDFPPGIRLVRLNIPTTRRAGQFLPPAIRRTLSLRRAIAETKPDVVISFLRKVNTMTLAAMLGQKARVIISERNNPRMQPAHWLWRGASALLYSRAHAIICQTRASEICIPRYHRPRVRVIPNPVVPIGTRPKPEGMPIRIAAVGRLERQKGFDLLIDAYAEVAAEFPNCVLNIWGEGPLRRELEAQVHARNIEDRVVFRGLSSRPGGWIEEADMFVLSSRFEGFPNVLSEAMAAGLPVIATRCDFGPAELIRDGENGLLVEPESPRALARALQLLLANPDLRRQLSAAAPEVKERFAPAGVWAQWQAVVEEALQP